MARTKRNIAYKHYWSASKERAREHADNWKGSRYHNYFYRFYLLHGTDSKAPNLRTRRYFNDAHRVGRRVARDQLRPQYVMEEDFDFDDARYTSKYKGVWWEIY